MVIQEPSTQKRSFKRKDAWQIVPYDKEHIYKYWY